MTPWNSRNQSQQSDRLRHLSPLGPVPDRPLHQKQWVNRKIAPHRALIAIERRGVPWGKSGEVHPCGEALDPGEPCSVVAARRGIVNISRAGATHCHRTAVVASWWLG